MDYLNTFRAQAETPANTFRTGNDLVDGLLRQKLSPAAEQGIEIRVSLDFRQGGFLDPFDLCVLLGNALDNAVEACMKLNSENRLIEVSGGVSASCLLIRIENPCTTGAHFMRKLPHTTKENANLHGFGLRNIRQVLDRYGGNLTITLGPDSQFISTMLIPLPGEIKVH